MKIYKVTIDNNPGEWKSGYDKTILVIADSKEDAIQKVINGWSEYYDYDNKIMLYGQSFSSATWLSQHAKLSASEIYFEGYDVLIGLKDIRKEKLNRIGNGV